MRTNVWGLINKVAAHFAAVVMCCISVTSVAAEPIEAVPTETIIVTPNGSAVDPELEAFVEAMLGS